MSFIAKVTSKGQMTLPAKLRKELDINAGDHLELTLSTKGEIRMRKSSQSFESLRGIVKIKGAAKNIDKWIEEARAEMGLRGLR